MERLVNRPWQAQATRQAGWTGVGGVAGGSPPDNIIYDIINAFGLQIGVSASGFRSRAVHPLIGWLAGTGCDV
jgi:hypothetical protein